MLATQPMKRLQRDYASGAGSSEATLKAWETDHPHASMAPLITRWTDSESKQGAKYVEDGSSVLRPGIVKTLGNCGSQTVWKLTEKFGNSSGQVGKMKVAGVPQDFCKQTMRNSSELAKSRRPLTANVENKWFSNLHENVNSANSQNTVIHSGTPPESRKRDLPLPKPMSLDASCAQMAPHSNPNKATYISTHSDMPFRAFPHPNNPSVDFMRLDEPSVDTIDLISLVKPGGALRHFLPWRVNLGHK